MADRNETVSIVAQPNRFPEEHANRSNPDGTAQLSGPRVMFATTAQAGESLIGLIVRAARLNRLPRLQPLLGACTSAKHAELYLATREDIDFDQLAYAGRLSRDDVEARRYLRVMLTANLPGVQFHGAHIPAYDLNLRPRRLATSWITGGGIHCALGHHGLVTHCPISGDILIDRCSECGSKLTWTNLKMSRCGTCDCALAAGTIERVTRRELDATRLMLDLVHPDPARHQPAADSLHFSLAHMDRGTVFELGWRFGTMLVGNENTSRSNAKCLPVSTRLRILEAGSSILRRWPETVQSLMQGLAPGSSAPDAKLPNAVRIAATRNAWPAVREAVFAAVPGLCISAREGIRSVAANAANSAEMTRDLGVGQQVFARMRAANIFALISNSGSSNIHQIFDATRAERLKAHLADCVPLSAASERLGISCHGVEQLCCLAELQSMDDEAVIAGFKSRQISRSSFLTLWRRVEDRMLNSGRGSETIPEFQPIRRALRACGGREKPWGPIVVAMLSGRLPFAIDSGGTGPLMNRVLIAAGTAHVFATLHFNDRAYPTFEFSSRINRRDAEEMLNVDPSTFSRALANRELPALSGRTYDRGQILELACTRLSIGEALMRWSPGSRTLPQPLKGKRAPLRLGKLGWERASVEQIMTGGSMTSA